MLRRAMAACRLPLVVNGPRGSHQFWCLADGPGVFVVSVGHPGCSAKRAGRTLTVRPLIRTPQISPFDYSFQSDTQRRRDCGNTSSGPGTGSIISTSTSSGCRRNHRRVSSETLTPKPMFARNVTSSTRPTDRAASGEAARAARAQRLRFSSSTTSGSQDTLLQDQGFITAIAGLFRLASQLLQRA